MDQYKLEYILFVQYKLNFIHKLLKLTDLQNWNLQHVIQLSFLLRRMWAMWSIWIFSSLYYYVDSWKSVLKFQYSWKSSKNVIKVKLKTQNITNYRLKYNEKSRTVIYLRNYTQKYYILCDLFNIHDILRHNFIFISRILSSSFI